MELEGATDDRLIGESNLLPGISIHELLFGVSYAGIVNAAFTHAHPAGSRFNAPERGAWYAAFELETAEAEVAYAYCLDAVSYARSQKFATDLFAAGSHPLRPNGRRPPRRGGPGVWTF
ncbi:MAG: RES family NAD+ phosphorylase [Acidobacteria bacterium]|nr:RES family NAD+ phosphorylase [Acidobacteriota bacterium]